jgi:hypothetical protein
MEVGRYMELKEKGAVRLMALGKNHFAFGVRRYDAANGAELEPELERITREQVEGTKKALSEGVANCDALLDDMDALAADEPAAPAQ